MLTPQQREEIRERAEKATRGPWKTGFSDDYYVGGYSIQANGALAYCFEEKADAEFCAHARTDIPALLEHVEEVEKLLQTLLLLAGKNDSEITDADTNELQRIRQSLARKEGV